MCMVSQNCMTGQALLNSTLISYFELIHPSPYLLLGGKDVYILHLSYQLYITLIALGSAVGGLFIAKG